LKYVLIISTQSDTVCVKIHQNEIRPTDQDHSLQLSLSRYLTAKPAAKRASR